MSQTANLLRITTTDTVNDYVFIPQDSATTECFRGMHFWLGFPPAEGQPCACGKKLYRARQVCGRCGQELPGLPELPGG